MNLALTKLNELLRFPPTSIAICIFIFITVMSLAKSCENSSDNGFRVEHSARMGGGFVGDTTKPQRSTKIFNHYVLAGSDTLFRMLIFTIQNPDDVSKNQKTQLLNWIQTVKQDTLK